MPVIELLGWVYFGAATFFVSVGIWLAIHDPAVDERAYRAGREDALRDVEEELEGLGPRPGVAASIERVVAVRRREGEDCGGEG